MKFTNLIKSAFDVYREVRVIDNGIISEVFDCIELACRDRKAIIYKLLGDKYLCILFHESDECECEMEVQNDHLLLLALMDWLVNLVDLKIIYQHYGGVIAEAKALTQREAWDSVGTNGSLLQLKPLICACMHTASIRVLYPYASMGRLCFSRWSSYPYSNDCPFFSGTAQKYELYSSTGILLFEGDLLGVINEFKRVLSALPLGTKP